MNLLAIDTCTEVCSVSAYNGTTKISRFVEGVNKSSGLILPLCNDVLKEAQLKCSQLDGIIYTKGPGAFTGVRICVSVVQGLALANNTPTLGFSTLELIAIGCIKKYKIKNIAIALDARMGEVYWGVYKNNELTIESLKNPNQVNKLNSDFIGVGSGWGVHSAELSAQSGVKNYVTDFHPKAENLIDLALAYYAKHGKFEHILAKPKYLRNNVAHKSLK